MKNLPVEPTKYATQPISSAKTVDAIIPVFMAFSSLMARNFWISCGIANGATLVRNTSENSGHHPGGPTAEVSFGSIEFSFAEIFARPPEPEIVKIIIMITPNTIMMPKKVSSDAIDL